MTLRRLRLTAFAVAFAVLSAAAQGPQVDTTWTGQSSRATGFDAVRELSGRTQVVAYRQATNPRSLSGICDERTLAEEAARAIEQERFDRLPSRPSTPREVAQYVWTAYTLAQIRAYDGRMADSVARLEDARRVFDANRPLFDFPGADAFFDALIGVAELRRGELENCLAHPNAARCIFPITGEGQHTLTSGAEAAFAALTRSLARAPNDLESRWLLNVTAMTLGWYPDRVPAPYLIDPDRFASADQPARFVDVAPALGLDHTSRAGGVVMDDLDGDGRFDVAMSSVDPCEPLHVYFQTAAGSFEERTDSGIAEQLGGINLGQTDFDNDGQLDLFVMRGGWEFPMRNSLLRNEGGGRFTDVTEKAGLVDVPHQTHSAAWADFDRDGWLDVFVGHERTRSKLFRNNGDGSFADVTDAARLDHYAIVKAAAWGDYDRDGYPDLYLSVFDGPNVLFHNQGDGTFRNVTQGMGVSEPFLSFPAWFFDYDNDGWPDLFVASFVYSVVEVIKPYLGLAPVADTSRLYRNVGGRKFEDVTADVGLDRAMMAMGANFGDIDNDGWLDIYLGTGAPSYAALVPNLMFHNQQGERFSDVTTSTGTGHLQKGHAIAFGDIDDDGDQDILENMGGFVPGDAYPKALFRNAGNANHWLKIALRGVKTNRAAIGARLTLTVISSTGTERRISREVSTGGSFGASPLVQHIGLGDDVGAVRLEVYWPVSDSTQSFDDVPEDTRIAITELEDSFEVIAGR
jgi:FG-GAP-like repeat/ASPIC and UnbV